MNEINHELLTFRNGKSPISTALQTYQLDVAIGQLCALLLPLLLPESWTKIFLLST